MSFPPYLLHVFMDDIRFRSASIHYGVDIGFANPSVMSPYGYDGGGGAESYHNVGFTDADIAWQQRIRQVYSLQSGVRWYSDENIRSANLRAAIANGAIAPHTLAYVHPLQSRAGRYPSEFGARTSVGELLRMSAYRLHRIMVAYDLVPGSLQNAYARRQFRHTGPGAHHVANLVALFDFLGAHQVADRLRLAAA
ncbi:hypothetical protein Slin14017_G091550 [Septoria linicola]|nr:hypothetical protein Slin14017_G091550 [Septoria linicola]